MKTRFKAFALFAFPLAIVAGIACSFIKWGDETGFHGTGFPIAMVMWDKASNYSDDSSEDHLIDFPNPYGPVQNVLVFIITATVLFLAFEISMRTMKWLWTKKA